MDDLLIVLVCVAPLAVYLPVTRGHGRRRAQLAGIGLGLAFCYFALGHFMVTDELVVMLPPWVPQRRLLIHATGCLELLIAFGLLSGRGRRPAGIAAAVLLVLFLPANVYAAINHTGVGEHQSGPAYLWVRIPLQVFLLAWALWPVRWPDAPRARAQPV